MLGLDHGDRLAIRGQEHLVVVGGEVEIGEPHGGVEHGDAAYVLGVHPRRPVCHAVGHRATLSTVSGPSPTCAEAFRFGIVPAPR